MPLYVRKSVDHYPDRSPRLGAAQTDHVVLCGNLVVGLIEQIPHGPSRNIWHWGVSLGAGFAAGGNVETIEECNARARGRVSRAAGPGRACRARRYQGRAAAARDTVGIGRRMAAATGLVRC
jgi:hypothetical protein